MPDRKPIHKTAARSGLLFFLIAVIAILSLRIIYYRQKNHIMKEYISAQADLSGYVATDIASDFKGIMNTLEALKGSGLLSETGGAISPDVLLKVLNALRDTGALDLMVLSDKIAPISATGYLATTGMSPEEIHTFIMDIWNSSTTNEFVSETIQVDSREQGAGYIIMAGVDFEVPVSATTENKESGEEQQPGLLVLIISVQELNRKIQGIAATAANRMIFALDRNGFLVSHPHPEFIGSSSADTLYTDVYPELNKVVERMKMGEQGKDTYISLDSQTGRDDTRWHIGFSPVKDAGLSIGVAFQQSDIPDIDSLASTYIGFCGAVIFFLLVAYGVFIRERNKFLLMEKFASRLGDAAAVNEMLTNINSEITDDKRNLEAELVEVKSIFRERESNMKNIMDLYDQLETSLKKPSRSQRGLLNDLLREIKTLSRMPENRFRKISPKVTPEGEKDNDK